MALMKDGLWGIANGTETLGEGASADARAKFNARRDKALAILWSYSSRPIIALHAW